jgi:hypothetical protein
VRAAVGEVFYNVSVNPAEMWWEVGKVFQRARLDKGWTLMDVQMHGGPTGKTVKAIEAGKAGTVENLKKTAVALDLSIVDVLYSVLSKREKKLSPEAAFVVRRYEETTVAGRTALVATATRGADGAAGGAAACVAGPGRCGNASSARSIAFCPAGSNASY